MAAFFSKEWADEVREALEAGPSDEARASKLPEYWDFYALVRSSYQASWALGVRDLPRKLGGGPSYLFVQWDGGHVTDCRIVGPDDPLDATYVLDGDYADWVALLSGFDAQRTVMYRSCSCRRAICWSSSRRSTSSSSRSPASRPCRPKPRIRS